MKRYSLLKVKGEDRPALRQRGEEHLLHHPRLLQKRLVFYCRTTSASTACAAQRIVQVTVPRVSRSCEHFPDGAHGKPLHPQPETLNTEPSTPEPPVAVSSVHGVSSSLLGPAVPSVRALSGRLKFTVRRHKFNKDSLPFEQKMGFDTEGISDLVTSGEEAVFLDKRGRSSPSPVSSLCRSRLSNATILPGRP